MTGFTAFAIAGVLGALVLPSSPSTLTSVIAKAPTAAMHMADCSDQSRTTSARPTTPPRAAEEAMSYHVSIDQSSKDYGGKTTRKPTGRFETIVWGRNSRAEVISGGKDLKTGDVLLTNDGGDTIYWIRGRSYLVMDAEYRERLTREITSKMKMTITNGRVDTDESSGPETIAGLPTMHGRVSRSFDLGVRVLLMSVKVGYEDHVDVWRAADLAGAPSIEAAFYETFINMVPFGDETLRSGTEGAAAKMPRGFPVKWSHESVTRKDDGSTEEGSTTFIVSDIRRGAQAVDAATPERFELPEGLKRVEKW